MLRIGQMIKRLIISLLVVALLSVMSVANAKVIKPHNIKGYTTHFNFYTHKKH